MYLNKTKMIKEIIYYAIQPKRGIIMTRKRFN